jgi:prepilin-type N-terminal cleavage/methylation domain-containing protein
MTINLMPRLVNSSLFIVNGFKRNFSRPPTTNYEPQAKHGFTLIELLVVIAIIGVLASLATYTYTDSQKKSRDSRRKSDLLAIQKALELAKQDTAGNYSYPRCFTALVVTCVLTEPDSGHAADDRETSPVLSTTYIKAIPTDPKTGTGYTYSTFDNAGATCSTTGSCTAFNLIACLENAKDPQKDSNASGGNGFAQNTTVCGVFATTGLVSYTITNL